MGSSRPRAVLLVLEGELNTDSGYSRTAAEAAFMGKIAVTGTAGVIGRPLCDDLARDHEVVRNDLHDAPVKLTCVTSAEY